MNSKDKPLFMDIDDAHNAINSNILKQSMISQEPRDDDDAILAASNGKHENGDTDYDYSDLGPETNVDAIDDVTTMPVKNLSYEFYKDDDICHEDGQPDNDSNILDNRDIDESINANLNANTNIITHEQITDNNLHENDDDDDDEDDDEVDENDDNDNNDDELHQDNDDVPDDEVMVSKTVEDDIPENEIICEKMNNEICEQLMENIVDEKKTRVEDQADMPQDVVDEAGPVDYDESPPSPQANSKCELQSKPHSFYERPISSWIARCVLVFGKFIFLSFVSVYDFSSF